MSGGIHESEAKRQAERAYEFVTDEEWEFVQGGGQTSLRGKMRRALLDMRRDSDLRTVKIKLAGNERPHDLQRLARSNGVAVRGLVRDGWLYVRRRTSK